MASGGSSGGGRRREGASTKIFLSSISAAVAETATFPIDAVKTRLQLHGEALPGPHAATATPTGAFRVARDMLAREKGGVLGMYRGLPPAVLRHLVYTPLRITAYENLRGAGAGDSLLGRALSGGVSGVLAQVGGRPPLRPPLVLPPLPFSPSEQSRSHRDPFTPDFIRT